MKASWIWLLIGAVFGGVWFFRSRKPSAEKSDAIPQGAVIGQIGSRIEDSKGTQALAQALSEAAKPHVVGIWGNNNYNRMVWSDGRVTVTGGDGSIVVADNPFIPSP